MVVPAEIANAAARGDSATVLALRLRSLALRGRARSRRRATGAADPVIGRVLHLPNELCWHVLQFWRATSDAIGEPEVI